MAPSLSKLYTDRLPVLKGEASDLKSIALWLLMLKRWSLMNGMKVYMFDGETAAELADVSEGKLQMRRDATRYLHAAIENPALSGDVADNPDHVDCPRAIAFIRAQWLNNRGESEVLTDELNRITYDESKSIQTFISEFAMLINNIEPIIPSRRACELFAERLSSLYDTFIAAADTDPGRESVAPGGAIDHRRSWRAWANAVAKQIQAVQSRNQARERRLGKSNIPGVNSPPNCRVRCSAQPFSGAKV